MADSKKSNPSDDCMLLALPRELRDDIYKHYLRVEGGYVYNFESGKLRCATSTGTRAPIDLELMLSCRQIAAEMRGLALKTNVITFRPVAPPAKQSNLQYLLNSKDEWWDAVFQSLQEKNFNHPLRSSRKDWWPVPNFDESICRTVSEEFPKFEPHLRLIQRLASEPSNYAARFDVFNDEEHDFTGRQVYWPNIGYPIYWGEVPSLQRQAALKTLELISSRESWSEKAWSDVEDDPGWRAGSYRVPTTDRAADIIRYHSLYKPWTIIEDAEGDGIEHDRRHPAHYRDEHKTQEDYEREPHENFDPRYWNRHFLSAASIAIHFLENIPSQRKNIRKIILDERYPGQNFSECHGLGFIGLCKENPALRVERRANLWTNVWQPETCLNNDGMTDYFLTERVACWIVEALALAPAGMPQGSFTLVLDGNPAPEQCTKLFQRVQRDAAWHTAFLETFDRGILHKVSYDDMRRTEGFMYVDFPPALQDISRGTCLAVRANFDVGEPMDVEAMIEAHREWTLSDWERGWDLSTSYQTLPPLPEWKVICDLRNSPEGVPWFRD
ncbi:hypothetical protein KVR01_012226 [Diaporthe batatas]|uniref:uncharacterized protein n=1 Tax=Diaporthe batatas TaxID=748121 RepID=UPI001D04614F|nr:uncharacterized protein KVR01_012226 [Diaporthe batatas]KAG8157954.1 hypothetical protein KVR01_012226 [Diaporthe batatas]